MLYKYDYENYMKNIINNNNNNNNNAVDLAPRQCKHLRCYIGGFFTVSLV